MCMRMKMRGQYYTTEITNVRGRARELIRSRCVPLHYIAAYHEDSNFRVITLTVTTYKLLAIQRLHNAPLPCSDAKDIIERYSNSVIGR